MQPHGRVIWKKFDVYCYLDKNKTLISLVYLRWSPVNFTHIKTLSPVRSKQLASILNDHDYFITASLDDPCSNSLVEAINCGLIPIVRNSGGHPEIINTNGYLFNDSRDIISVIESIDSSRIIYKKDSFKQCGNEYVYLFQKIINKKNKKFTLIDFLNFIRLILMIYIAKYSESLVRRICKIFPVYIKSKFKRTTYNILRKKYHNKILLNKSTNIEYIVNKLPNFFINLTKENGYLSFTVSGDIYKRELLSTSVFAAKLCNLINFDYGLDERINNIFKYKQKCGSIYDHYLFSKSFLNKLYFSSRGLNVNKHFENIYRAETRQSLAVLKCNLKNFDTLHCFSIDDFVNYESYISGLNWKNPWSAISHDHLVFL